MKNIKSSDPRKNLYVAALKALAGVTKITNVKEDGQFVYGDALKLGHTAHGSRCYENLGTFKVPKDIRTMA